MYHALVLPLGVSQMSIAQTIDKKGALAVNRHAKDLYGRAYLAPGEATPAWRAHPGWWMFPAVFLGSLFWVGVFAMLFT